MGASPQDTATTANVCKVNSVCHAISTIISCVLMHVAICGTLFLIVKIRAPLHFTATTAGVFRVTLSCYIPYYIVCADTCCYLWDTALGCEDESAAPGYCYNSDCL